MYPLTGEVGEVNGMAQASTMMAERIVFKLHHLFAIGDSSQYELCGQTPSYFMQKSRYRYQMVYPTQENPQPFGRTTALWATNFNFHMGDDAAFVIWRKHNCCGKLPL